MNFTLNIKTVDPVHFINRTIEDDVGIIFENSTW